jgi:hypothetical protein
MTKIQSSAGHPNATCATSQERRHLPASRHLEKQRTHAIVHSHKQIGFHNVSAIKQQPAASDCKNQLL